MISVIQTPICAIAPPLGNSYCVHSMSARVLNILGRQIAKRTGPTAYDYDPD